MKGFNPSNFTVQFASPRPTSLPVPVKFVCTVCNKEITAISYAVTGAGKKVCNPCAAERLRGIAGAGAV